MKLSTVFIIDDDQTLHEVLGHVLRLNGFDVIHAYDGVEAIEKFKNLSPKPHIILMDHRMPLMSGTKVTKELLKIESNACIIFVSADDSAKSDAIEAGAKRFLTKPVRSKILISEIIDILKLKEETTISTN
jgi:two-component system nitrogen regulation response regulator NtrX